MAKPFELSDIPRSPFINSDPDSFSSMRVPASRKRPRDSEDDSANVAEDSQKTRRVNPQRLAARLGADLVAEMEALIYPGAKMPTFEVRRVIQERYAVDRRHIYDYFHSRGLRVAKEDKHTNLTRGRLSKALAKQLLEKALPDPGSTENPLTSIENQPIESQSVQHHLKSQPAANQSVENQSIENQPIKQKVASVRLKLTPSLEKSEQLSFRNAKRLASERISELKFGRRRPTLSGETSSSTANKHLPSKSRRRTTPAPPIPVDVPSNLLARTPSPCPEFTMSDETLGCHGREPHVPAFHPSSESSSDQCDITDFSLDTSLDDYQSDSLAAIEEHRPLTEVERLELYNLINNNISTSGGIEECAGTYRAYMKERSQHYFDRISFKANYGTRIYRVHQGELRSSTRAMGDDAQVDFQKWLSGPDERARGLFTPEFGYSGGYLATQPRHAPEKLLCSTYTEHSSSHLNVNGRKTCLEIGSRASLPSEVHNHTKASPLGNKSRGAVQSTLHYEYDIDLSPKPSASVAFDETTEDRHLQATQMLPPSMIHRRRPSNRPHAPPHAPTPSTRIEATTRPSMILYPNAAFPVPSSQASGFVGAYSYYPDCQNAVRSALYGSRPTHLRTMSAGGGI